MTTLNVQGQSILNDVSANHMELARLTVRGQTNLNDVSASNIYLTGNLINNNILNNYRILSITSDNLSSGAVFLICVRDGGENECVGKFYYQISTGHDGSGFVDIVVSSRNSSGDIPHGFCSYQTDQETSDSTASHKFSLITGIFSGIVYVGLKYEGGDTYPFSEAYFDGLWKSTGTNTPFEMKVSSSVTSQTPLPIGYSELSLQNKRLVINTNGNVGINQTNPTATLDVGGTLNASNTAVGGTLDVIGETSIASANINTLTNQIITSTNRIIINNSEPTLYLKDTNHRSGMIYMNNNIMYFLSGDTNSETWTQVNGKWPLYLQTDTNTAVFGGGIQINGRSYIGSQFTANQNALDVDAVTTGADDAIGFRSKVDTYNILHFYNVAGARRGNVKGVNSSSISFLTTSDIRRKKDITDLENGLEKVMKLKPRTYRWKDCSELDDGFIAQEVFETLPNLIPFNRFKCDISQNDVYHGKLCSCCNIEKTSNGEDYIFGLDYGKFTPYLCKAIQEQQEIIKTMKLQIETLKTQYNALSSRL